MGRDIRATNGARWPLVPQVPRQHATIELHVPKLLYAIYSHHAFLSFRHVASDVSFLSSV